MHTKDLISSIAGGYGWATADYVADQTDDTPDQMMQALRDLEEEKLVDYLTIKEVHAFGMEEELQDFEELTEGMHPLEYVIICK